MKRIAAWAALAFGTLYFLLPLMGMTEFSLKMRRGVYSLDAYARVLADPKFQETFSYSVIMAVFTILFGVLLVVPTAYWVRLKLPRARPYVEFVTLLPLVILAELGGGLALIAGFLTRLTAAALALFCIASAVIFHGNFADQMQQILFMKNLAMAGGFLALVAHGAGSWSVDSKLGLRF